MSDLSAIPALIAWMQSDTGGSGVNTLISGRMYADLAPEVGEQFPNIVLAEENLHNESEYGGTAGLVETNVTVECRGTTKAQANAIATAAVKLMADQSGVYNGQTIQGAFLDDEASQTTAVPAMGPDYQIWIASLVFTVWFQFP